MVVFIDFTRRILAPSAVVACSPLVMRVTSFMRGWRQALLFGAGLAMVPSGSAQSGGCHIVSIRSGADNPISLPFQREVAAEGGVLAVGEVSVRLAGVEWTRDQFVRAPGVQENTFYAMFASGALEGVFYRVVANTADTLVLDTENDNLLAHPAGSIAIDDVVEVRPYWTLGSVFGAVDSELILASRPTRFTAADDVMLPNNLAAGTGSAKVSAGGTFYFLRNAGWRLLGDPTNADRAHTLLPPGQMFTVRRRGVGGLELISFGELMPHRVSVFVQGGNGTVGNDSYLSIVHPEPLTLNEAGLVDPVNPEAGAVLPSASLFSPSDQVLVYTLPASGFGVVPSRSFFYVAGLGWRELGSAAGNVGETIRIEPGQAVVIRKARTSGGTDWLQPR